MEMVNAKIAGTNLGIEDHGILAEVERLRAELAVWKPLTQEEAQKAYDEAEAVPMSEDQIQRIVKRAMDPAERLPNSDQAQLAVDNERLRAELAALKESLVGEEIEQLHAEIAALKADEQLLVNLWRSPAFYHEGQEGDSLNWTPARTAVEILKRQYQENVRYGMSAGMAHQYRAEAKAARVACGFDENSEEVSPSMLTEHIAALKIAPPSGLGEELREWAEKWIVTMEKSLRKDQLAEILARHDPKPKVEWMARRSFGAFLNVMLE